MKKLQKFHAYFSVPANHLCKHRRLENMFLIIKFSTLRANDERNIVYIMYDGEY